MSPKSRTRVFISYSHKNSRRAERLAKALKAHGIQVWFDQWDILVGHNLADQIYSAITSADFLLVLLTKASVNSRWVKEELDFAKMRELESGGTVIIPLMYEQCELPPSLKTKVPADFTSSFEDGFTNITRMLIARPPEKARSDGPLRLMKKLGTATAGSQVFMSRQAQNVYIFPPGFPDSGEPEILDAYGAHPTSIENPFLSSLSEKEFTDVGLEEMFTVPAGMYIPFAYVYFEDKADGWFSDEVVKAVSDGQYYVTELSPAGAAFFGVQDFENPILTVLFAIEDPDGGVGTLIYLMPDPSHEHL